ncbi:DegT/DnrJ/EryC1/StrS family aminotransferase [Thaumasiovibrio subtropicus]|uniref:DegT/DnrJ/EryC1/StrS family aminotransferase n=1 Tax=Thaumasiovibrio subtropicus TaxID=1891207 RepID=UPI000B35D479|nr:DegT/DnrJ/EryC1/StrS family aminotransferase [Thaumasiovibrio subtropicus]
MTPFDIQKTSDETVLFSQLYQNITFYPYARFALYEYLKSIEAKSIYLPEFICSDVLEPINAIGIDVSYYEVNEDLTPGKLSQCCDAILMVNYFGFEQDITPFSQYKKQFGAVLIEDNAHGLFSRDRYGNLLGGRGDAGLLSLRKTLSLPNGAALILKNGIKVSASQVATSLDDHRHARKDKFRQRLPSPILGIAAFLFKQWLSKLRKNSQASNLDANAFSQQEYLSPMLEQGDTNVDIEAEITRRIGMYKLLTKIAEKYGVTPIYSFYDGVVPYLFAYIDRSDDNRFSRAILSKGFFTLSWPDLPPQVSVKDKTFYNKVKVVPFLW